MDNKEKHRLQNNWEYAQKIWNIKYKEFKLKGWSLKKDHAKTRLGQCDHSKRIVSISTYFMRGKSCRYAKVKDTILHEIAHVLTPGHGHDRMWKNMCVKIGASPRICATMDIPPRSWVMICNNCNWRKEYYRKPVLHGRVCLKCKKIPRIKSLK